MVEVQDGWEYFKNPENENRIKAANMQFKISDAVNYEKKSKCTMLNADEYLLVGDKSGHKSLVNGPQVYRPDGYGDVWGEKQFTITIPVNCYIIVQDTNSSDEPIRHIRGPRKFTPTPFEIVKKNPSVRTKNSRNGEEYHFECIHISAEKACHVQMKDGSVELVDEAQFFMPQVGQRVLSSVQLNLLLNTDFCIIKEPSGVVTVLDGRNDSDRAFFMKPFHEFIYFRGDNNDQGQYILSRLPQFLNHQFMIRTSDNVGVDMVIRISYQITEVEQLSNNPIQFVKYMQNYIQDDFLDRFSKLDLSNFMKSFTAQAISSISGVNVYFEKFGISVLDIQILDFHCHEDKVEKMLEAAIHTSVTKSNTLRAVQNEVLIQEQTNEIMRRQKDLEVQMALKENEVELQKVVLGNAIRIKEMEIQITEEEKRSELLEVKRGNDLVEFEFRGRAKGHNLREFMAGIDENLSTDEKVAIWKRSMELEQSEMLYHMVNEIRIQPANATMKILNFTKPGDLQGDASLLPDKNEFQQHKHNFLSDHEKRALDRKNGN
jgi:hypothetical protein